jgi:hypothetical protein
MRSENSRTKAEFEHFPIQKSRALVMAFRDDNMILIFAVQIVCARNTPFKRKNVDQ